VPHGEGIVASGDEVPHGEGVVASGDGVPHGEGVVASGDGVPHGEGVVASGDCGISDHSLPHVSTLTGSCIFLHGHRTRGSLIK
jgi:hypothetical protein